MDTNTGFNAHSKHEIVIDNVLLTRFALVFLIAILVFTIFPFYFLWDYDALSIGFSAFIKEILLLIVPIVIVHEGLHGIVWFFFAKAKFKSIKFGFNVAMLSPYTHCKEPLLKWGYFWGGLAPLVVMGIIPLIYALISGSGFWLFTSIFCTWSAAGDVLSCWYLLKIPGNCSVLDHPDSIGFYVVDNE